MAKPRKINPEDVALEKGLPASPEAERYVLGSILLEGNRFDEVRDLLEPNAFSLEKHRRIFAAMDRVRQTSRPIDRLTIAEELMAAEQLESVDGVGYLVSLDDGLPHIENLESYARIVHEKATLRKAIFASQNFINRCLSGEKPGKLSGAAEEILLALGTDEVGTGPQTPAQIIESFPGGINAFLDPASRQTGLETGILRFDEMTGGLHPGELMVLAARPAMGKTALALNIAQFAALKRSKTVMIFSLEMSKEALLNRLTCGMARVNLLRFRLGYLDAEERRRLRLAAVELAEAPLYIDDTSATTLPELHARVRRRLSAGPVDLVVIDYLQLMRGSGQYDSRVQEVTEISRGLKLMAKEIDAPVMALSQLSRAPELRRGNARPMLSDLRESGSIEQDADLVAFIYREEVYKPDRDDLRGRAELLLSKQRNGPTGKIDLVFLHSLTKFENRVEDFLDFKEQSGKDSAAGKEAP